MKRRITSFNRFKKEVNQVKMIQTFSYDNISSLLLVRDVIIRSKGLFIWRNVVLGRRVTLHTEPPQARELFIHFLTFGLRCSVILGRVTVLGASQRFSYNARQKMASVGRERVALLPRTNFLYVTLIP